MAAYSGGSGDYHVVNRLRRQSGRKCRTTTKRREPAAVRSRPCDVATAVLTVKVDATSVELMILTPANMITEKWHVNTTACINSLVVLSSGQRCSQLRESIKKTKKRMKRMNKKSLESFYMKWLRRILRVSWTAKKTNEWVLNTAWTTQGLLDFVKARKLVDCTMVTSWGTREMSGKRNYASREQCLVT